MKYIQVKKKMSCSYLFTGDASVASRRWNDVSFRQRVFLPRQSLRQPLPSLSQFPPLVATANDNFTNQSLSLGMFAGDMGGNNDNGNGSGGDDGWWFNGGDNSDDPSHRFRFICLLFLVFFQSQLSAAAFAKAPESESNGDTEKDTVFWEVRGSKRKRLVPDYFKDEFVSQESSFELSSSLTPQNLLAQCRNLLIQFLLPEGYPNSVTSDYLDYSLWRGVQGIASQISAVLATQVHFLSLSSLLAIFTSTWCSLFLVGVFFFFLGSLCFMQLGWVKERSLLLQRSIGCLKMELGISVRLCYPNTDAISMFIPKDGDSLLIFLKTLLLVWKCLHRSSLSSLS